MAAKKSSRKLNGNTGTISSTNVHKSSSNKKKKKSRAMTISHHLSNKISISTNSDSPYQTPTTNRMELFDCFVECLTSSGTCGTKKIRDETNEFECMESQQTQVSSPAAKLLNDEERRFVQRFDELNRQLDKLRSLQSNLSELDLDSQQKNRKTSSVNSEEDHYEQFLNHMRDLNKNFDVEMSYLSIWHKNQKSFVNEQFEQECKYLSDEFEKKKSELKEKLLNETLEQRRQLKIDIDLIDLSQVNSTMPTNVINGTAMAHGPNLNQPTLIRRKLRRRGNQKQIQSQLAQQSVSN
jgi:hypothetical protein